MVSLNKDNDFIFLVISVCVIASIAYFIANVKTVKFPEVIPYNLSYTPRGNSIPAEGAENKSEYRDVE